MIGEFDCSRTTRKGSSLSDLFFTRKARWNRNGKSRTIVEAERHFGRRRFGPQGRGLASAGDFAFLISYPVF
jgi:hypothetical protein